MEEMTGEGSGVPAGSDAVTAAIVELEEAIAANVADERMLVGRLRALRRAHRQGRPWRTILHEEAAPTTLSLAGRVGRRLGGATRLLRRTLALSLLGEGATTSEVAGHFAVSRQRVSHLVRNPGRSSAEDAGPG